MLLSLKNALMQKFKKIKDIEVLENLSDWMQP